MSAGDRPCCSRCGGRVGIDDRTGQPWPLCGQCHRGVEPGLCLDCKAPASRLRCGPCHQAYKAARDGVAPPARPALTIECVRCGAEIGMDRPCAVTPVCDRCRAKAEEAKAERARKSREGQRRGRRR